MNTTENRPLDPYETALLDDLRALVEGRNACPEPGQRPNRRPLIAVAAAAAVVIGGGAAGVMLRPTPAFAVTGTGRGDVKVTVHRIEDAAGLQAALEAEGIPADITYLPYGQQCAAGRYAPARTNDHRIMSIGKSEDGLTVTMPREWFTAGRTFVLQTSFNQHGGKEWEGTTQFDVGIAQGPVAPCVPVAAPPALPPAQ